MAHGGVTRSVNDQSITASERARDAAKVLQAHFPEEPNLLHVQLHRLGGSNTYIGPILSCLFIVLDLGYSERNELRE